ncbi:MAG: hypothetical protein Q4B28_05040 [bacterium]|nr:hypothetical protein [bacterium]
MQGGSYIVQYYCDFYYPQGHDTREIQKLWLSLWYNGQVDAMRTTQRACMSQD